MSEKNKGVKKTGVLLMAYGSPENEDEIETYYTHIRGGRRPSNDELENLRARYKAIGGKSPLLGITKSTAEKLQKRLREQQTGDINVYAGMKHAHPFISETFDQIYADDINELLALALAPHYSKMSVASYQDSVRKADEEHGGKVKLHFVNNWHVNSIFLDKLVVRIRDAREKKFGITVENADSSRLYYLFTAHSLPERILGLGDPYKKQLLETSGRLAERLGLGASQYGFAFQSAGHTSEPWLGPEILDKLAELKRDGWNQILVIPIGFVSDHLEILYDLDIESKNRAKELGLHLERTESFNDSDDFVEVLVSVVLGDLPFENKS